MLRDIGANNRKPNPEVIQEKYTDAELASILANAKEKLPRLVARYAKEMKSDFC